jgi:hypothetical protein
MDVTTMTKDLWSANGVGYSIPNTLRYQYACTGGIRKIRKKMVELTSLRASFV